MTSREPLRLGLSLDQHGRMGAWRIQRAAPVDRTDLATHARLAQCAEEAGFDFVFIADVLRFQPSWGNRGVLGGTEPITVLSALSALTNRVGLVGSVSTTFSHPYTLARQLASLDHLSNGRVGWNIVTSYDGERNYGADELPTQEQRYARAEEFLAVTTGLWQSWGRRVPGELFDLDRIRPIDHHGDHFDVEGPLDIQPPIQTRPVIFQAGASPEGRDFAAAQAEVVFAAVRQKTDATEFARDIHVRAASLGRAPHTPLILPGLTIYLAATDDEAHRQYRGLVDAFDTEAGVAGLSGLLGVDLRALPLDAPIDPALLPSYSGERARRRSRPELFARLAEEGHTVRRLTEIFSSTHGHREVVGSALTIADDIESWSDQTGVDGFILSLGFGPSSADLLVEDLAPELARRGLLAPRSDGTTLREQLRLREPVSL